MAHHVISEDKQSKQSTILLDDPPIRLYKGEDILWIISRLTSRIFPLALRSSNRKDINHVQIEIAEISELLYSNKKTVLRQSVSLLGFITYVKNHT